MKQCKQKGLTIIELVVVIVVLGLAIPPLLTSWANIGWRFVRSESLADATFYAQELMEEIKSKRFDEKTVSPWTSSIDFGYDTGENGNNKDTFNDADDFVTTGTRSCTDPLVIAPATSYSRSVTVDYVTLSTNTWIPSASPTNFKRVRVSVSHSRGLVKDVTLVTIVSAY